MACSVEPLVVGKVIGDVIDMFMPSISLAVYYGSKQVTNGCYIKPSITINPPKVQIFSRVNSLNPPKVQISGPVNSLFTLVLTDPDAPSPSEPSMREFVHWIVVNIPGSSVPYQGNEILPYMSPRPPIGIHRFVFVLFQQQTPITTVTQPPLRSNFKTRAFAAQYGLGLPVSAVYFNAQKEPAAKRR